MIFKLIEKLAFRKAFSYRLWIEVRQTIFKQMNFQNCTSVGNFEKWLSLRITFPTFARKMVENVDSLFFCLTLSVLYYLCMCFKHTNAQLLLVNFNRIVWTNWLENWSDSIESQTNKKLTQFYSILFFLYRNETYFSPCKVRFLLSLFFHFYYLVGLHLFTELAVGLGDLLQSEKKVPYALHYKPRFVYFLPHFQRTFLCF